MLGYEQFGAAAAAQDSGGAPAITFNESASEEVECWKKLFQSVPVGVLKRKQQEDQEELLEQRKRNSQLEKTSSSSSLLWGGSSSASCASSCGAAGATTASSSSEAEAKKHWMPDNVCRVCYRCELAFTLFRRRHHCRVCGLVFCGDCSANYVNGAQYGFSQFVRACDECYEQTTSTHSIHRTGSSNSVLLLASSPPGGPILRSSSSMLGGNSSAIEDSTEDLQQLVIVDEDDREVQDITAPAPLKQPPPPPPPSTPKFAKSSLQQLEEEESSQLIFSSSSSSGSGSGFTYPRVSQATEQAFAARERRLINSLLLNSFGGNEAAQERWGATLVQLSETVCASVLPTHGDALSVLDYVSIHLLPGRTPEESYKVTGAVLCKKTLHCRMPRSLFKPRIMLLESGLELNRGAHQHKLISFEKLIEQERLYLELVVRKICSVQIDVLLCGGTISPVALDLLLERNIAVASTVSKQDLKWVARMTGASIIPTTESFTRLVDPTGTCQHWRMESMALADTSTWDTYMLFENAPVPQGERGCTVMLRGESTMEALAEVAGELRSLLLRMWTIRLDHAFVACMDGKLPPSSSSSSLYGQYERLRGEEEEERDEDDEELAALHIPGLNVTRVHQFEQKQQPNTASNSHLVSFHFYHPRRDRTVEEFLLSAFKKQNYTLLYLHGFGRIAFSPVEPLSKADVETMGPLMATKKNAAASVVTWANCQECGVQTNVYLVHPLTLHMSFGRFLQNTFYMQGLRLDHGGAAVCEHSLMHSFTRYFCQGELMLSMQFEPGVPLTIKFPGEAMDMTDSTWYDAFSLALYQELKSVAQQVVQHFTNTSCELTCVRRVEEILAKLERALPMLPAPNEMNITYRDLFLQCMEWNVWIQSENNVASKPPMIVLPPMPLPPLQHVLLSSSSGSRRANFRVRYNSHHPFNNNALLSRRPSLMEIQTARQRILVVDEEAKRPPSLALTRSASAPDSPRTTASTVASGGGGSRTPQLAPLHATSSSSARTLLVGLTTSPSLAALGGATSSSSTAPARTPHARKTMPALNKTLPARLVEGHLLLPPGRRLGSAVVPVLEDEPSSWIAHALCSNHYSEKLQGLLKLDVSSSAAPASSTAAGSATSTSSSSTGAAAASTGNASKWVLTPASTSEMVLTADEEQFHIRSGFSDASEYAPRQCAFSVLSYFAAQFHQLRMLYMRKGSSSSSSSSSTQLPDEFFEKRFIDSLSRCTAWRPTGGKSTATFLKTLDGRFIIKSISQTELDTFADIALQYFAHLSTPASAGSLLVPFLGIFSLTMQSEVVLGRRALAAVQPPLYKPNNSSQLGSVQSSRLLVAVMPNIFFNQAPAMVYDLKGNAPNKSRFVKNPAQGSVRLDWNFCQDNGGVPLALHPAAKDAFARAVLNDALFLASVGVVDYSLLVGVSCEGEEEHVAVGVIDYLQVYTIQKMLESTVKKLGQTEPTVVSPNKYQARFVLAMEKYFVSCGRYSFSPCNSTTPAATTAAKKDEDGDEDEDASTTSGGGDGEQEEEEEEEEEEAPRRLVATPHHRRFQAQLQVEEDEMDMSLIERSILFQ